MFTLLDTPHQLHATVSKCPKRYNEWQLGIKGDNKDASVEKILISLAAWGMETKYGLIEL